MTLEIVRTFLIDLCLILALILTFRVSIHSVGVAMGLRAGLVFLLIEDFIRFSIGFGISLAHQESYVAFDVVRSWASVVGAAGAVAISLSLFSILYRGDKPRASPAR